MFALYCLQIKPSNAMLESFDTSILLRYYLLRLSLIRKAKYELYEFDRLYLDKKSVIIGIDEAGRGPLAGPVVAAAVALDLNNPIYGLDDSKKLAPKIRKSLYGEITSRALGWSVAFVDEDDIFELNILWASLKAMFLAARKLKINNPLYIVDGNRSVYGLYPQVTIVKGDSLSASIAAASIIAKVTRDKFMTDLSSSYPQYGFERHFGYATKEHIRALNEYGPCPHHRRYFEPVRIVLEKFQ